MNDRELLERAAQAAGFQVCNDRNALGLKERGPGLWVRKEKHGSYELWDPLEDDGEAFRLANYLHLCVGHTLGGIVGAHGTAMAGLNAWENTAPLARVRYDGPADVDAATRRAIVFAAAAIGAAQ